MKIIVTGLSGLVGSRIEELLNNKYEFENLGSSNGVDITQKESVLDFVKSSDSPLLIHLAGKTDVDGCEEDKEEDLRILGLPTDQQEIELKTKKTAWSVNVLGTKNVVDACIKTNKRIIHISTDFVFNGEKNEPYVEEDLPNPINWYGKTKFEAEKIINSSKVPSTILRIAYPYRAYFLKKDLIRVLIEKLADGSNLRMVDDNVITPTFIDDLAMVLDFFIEKNYFGIYHSTGSQSLSPFEIAIKICEVFGFDKSLVGSTKAQEFYQGRAKRPSQLVIKNDKLSKLGIRMKTLEEGLKEMKK